MPIIGMPEGWGDSWDYPDIGEASKKSDKYIGSDTILPNPHEGLTEPTEGVQLGDDMFIIDPFGKGVDFFDDFDDLIQIKR